MTKQQAIKKAYGVHYDTYRDIMDPDGWVNVHDADPPEALPRDKRYDMGAYWRPKSLRGIENNRGWISVEDRLPDEEEVSEQWVALSDGSIFFAKWRLLHDNWEISGFGLTPPGTVTHWQPVVKPETPIY